MWSCKQIIISSLLTKLHICTSAVRWATHCNGTSSEGVCVAQPQTRPSEADIRSALTLTTPLLCDGVLNALPCREANWRAPLQHNCHIAGVRVTLCCTSQTTGSSWTCSCTVYTIIAVLEPCVIDTLYLQWVTCVSHSKPLGLAIGSVSTGVIGTHPIRTHHHWED